MTHVSADANSVEVRIPGWVSDRMAIDKNPLRQVFVRFQDVPLFRSGGRTYIDLDDGRRVGLAGRTPRLAPYRLSDIARLRRPLFTISIAQPGLSRRIVSRPQLELLAST